MMHCVDTAPLGRATIHTLAHNCLKKRKEYLEALQSQMQKKQQELQELNMSLNEETKCTDTERKHYQDRVQQIREKKLQQLRAYNVPDKYLREIEKKCQQAHKAKFTYSYFGLK